MINFNITPKKTLLLIYYIGIFFVSLFLGIYSQSNNINIPSQYTFQLDSHIYHEDGKSFIEVDAKDKLFGFFTLVKFNSVSGFSIVEKSTNKMQLTKFRFSNIDKDFNEKYIVILTKTPLVIPIDVENSKLHNNIMITSLQKFFNQLLIKYGYHKYGIAEID